MDNFSQNCKPRLQIPIKFRNFDPNFKNFLPFPDKKSLHFRAAVKNVFNIPAIKHRYELGNQPISKVPLPEPPVNP
jgi:hypothetical protein